MEVAVAAIAAFGFGYLLGSLVTARELEKPMRAALDEMKDTYAASGDRLRVEYEASLARIRESIK